MAESAIRSPHRNPNSRSSEINNHMRKSFGGNPFAKPSIVAKQKGFNPETIPSSMCDHEDKENEKEHELKQARIRSPSVSKGTKHFMSPTISAACKAAASPKTKVLSEKNNPLRPSYGKASVSFSDVNHDTAVAELDNVAHLNDSETDMHNDFDVSDHVSRPYDPKTNFTSPRPQFLRYRPNPRIKKYLEDRFASESSSDAEFAEEIDILSEDSHIDSEDVSSGEMLEVSLEMVRDGEEMQKRASKLHFLKRPKAIAFVLTLLLACLSVSVTDSPILGLVQKDSHYSNFHLPAKFTEYDAKAHLDGFTQSFELWYGKSISYFSELVSKVREEPELGTLKYFNLTALYDDCYLIHKALQPQPMTGLESDEESEFEVHCNDIESEVNFTPEAEFPETNSLESQEIEESDDFAVPDTETIESEVNFTPDANAPETNVLESQEIEESDDFAAPDMETFFENSMEAPAALSEAETDLHTESSEESSFNLKDELLKLKANPLGIALLVIALLAAIALFIHVKKQNTPSLSNASVPEDQILTKKTDNTPKSVSASVVLSFEERLSSSRYSPMEVEMIGESCPSGTSSFQKSSYYSEAQSQERKTRKSYKRESMASSDDYSVGSLSSYGSFTTYDTISAKRENGGEITPVRRSSRLRKQVMSP